MHNIVMLHDDDIHQRTTSCSKSLTHCHNAVNVAKCPYHLHIRLFGRMSTELVNGLFPCHLPNVALSDSTT